MDFNVEQWCDACVLNRSLSLPRIACERLSHTRTPMEFVLIQLYSFVCERRQATGKKRRNFGNLDKSRIYRCWFKFPTWIFISVVFVVVFCVPKKGNCYRWTKKKKQNYNPQSMAECSSTKKNGWEIKQNCLLNFQIMSNYVNMDIFKLYFLPSLSRCKHTHTQPECESSVWIPIQTEIEREREIVRKGDKTNCIIPGPTIWHCQHHIG